MDIIEHYLVVEAAERRCHFNTWTKVICEEVPQQNNFNDCGIYACMNGRNIAERSNYKFYLDISRIRRHMEKELLQSQLLNLKF